MNEVWKQFVWKRPKDLYKNEDPKLFEGVIEPNDIK
jgi:hypothetical protein